MLSNIKINNMDVTEESTNESIPILFKVINKSDKRHWDEEWRNRKQQQQWMHMTNDDAYLQLFIWIVASCQTEIDNFDSIAFACKAQYIFRLQIQVDDIVTVHELHCLAYLTHQNSASFFG